MKSHQSNSTNHGLNLNTHDGLMQVSRMCSRVQLSSIPFISAAMMNRRDEFNLSFYYVQNDTLKKENNKNLLESGKILLKKPV